MESNCFFFLVCCFVCFFSHAGVGKGISVTVSDVFCQTTLTSYGKFWVNSLLICFMFPSLDFLQATELGRKIRLMSGKDPRNERQQINWIQRTSAQPFFHHHLCSSTRVVHANQEIQTRSAQKVSDQELRSTCRKLVQMLDLIYFSLYFSIFWRVFENILLCLWCFICGKSWQCKWTSMESVGVKKMELRN